MLGSRCKPTEFGAYVLNVQLNTIISMQLGCISQVFIRQSFGIKVLRLLALVKQKVICQPLDLCPSLSSCISSIHHLTLIGILTILLHMGELEADTQAWFLSPKPNLERVRLIRKSVSKSFTYSPTLPILPSSDKHLLGKFNV